MTFEQLYTYIAGRYLRDRPVLTELYSDNLNGGDLVSSQTIVDLMNEAEEIFCTETECILDKVTTEVCKITLNDTDSIYPLHRSIINIKNASVRDTDGNVCPIYRIGDMYQQIDPKSAKVPGCYLENIRGRIIEFDVIPTDVGAVVTLNVVRSPITLYELPDGLDSGIDDARKALESELPVKYQRFIAYYIGTHVLAQRDVDGNANKDWEEANELWTNILYQAKVDLYKQQFGEGIIFNNPW